MEKRNMMEKTNALFINKELKSFFRIFLLVLLFVYITFRILAYLGLFMEEINCGAEKVGERNKKIFFEANGYRFDNADNRTNEKAFEGNYSVKLTPENQYGLSITLDIPKPKEEYEASVWCYVNKISTDTTGFHFLVASIGNVFWKGEYHFREMQNGWGKLNIKFSVPEGVYKDPLVFYCWNSSKNTVYYDNMVIKRKNYWKFFKQ